MNSFDNATAVNPAGKMMSLRSEVSMEVIVMTVLYPVNPKQPTLFSVVPCHDVSVPYSWRKPGNNASTTFVPLNRKNVENRELTADGETMMLNIFNPPANIKAGDPARVDGMFHCDYELIDDDTGVVTEVRNMVEGGRITVLNKTYGEIGAMLEGIPLACRGLNPARDFPGSDVSTYRDLEKRFLNVVVLNEEPEDMKPGVTYGKIVPNIEEATPAYTYTPSDEQKPTAGQEKKVKKYKMSTETMDSLNGGIIAGKNSGQPVDAQLILKQVDEDGKVVVARAFFRLLGNLERFQVNWPKMGAAFSRDCIKGRMLCTINRAKTQVMTREEDSTEPYLTISAILLPDMGATAKKAGFRLKNWESAVKLDPRLEAQSSTGDGIVLPNLYGATAVNILAVPNASLVKPALDMGFVELYALTNMALDEGEGEEARRAELRAMEEPALVEQLMYKKAYLPWKGERTTAIFAAPTPACPGPVCDFVSVSAALEPAGAVHFAN